MIFLLLWLRYNIFQAFSSYSLYCSFCTCRLSHGVNTSCLGWAALHGYPSVPWKETIVPSKNAGFGLQEISCCSKNGPFFVTCDGARLFYTSKGIRNQGQSGLRKRDVVSNHSRFASNTVSFRALFKWGHYALTNWKTEDSIFYYIRFTQCFLLPGEDLHHTKFLLFRHLCVFSGMS